jgi:hypothetical protein
VAFPVVQQAVENSTNTAGTSHVINLPTATAGQLLLIILDKGSTSATINAHASLTELLDEASANGLYIAYRWMDGSEPASYTLTSSASTRTASIAYRISGAMNPAVTPPQIGTTATGTSATPNPPASATPPSAKDYLFIAFAGMAGEEADDDTWGNTPPTNYTPSPPRQKSCGTAGTNLGGLILSAERQLNTGSSEDPGTFGVDVSAAWRAQTITIHPSDNKLVTPGIATLAIATFAATVSVTSNVRVTPAPATLTTTKFAPTVTSPRRVTPSTAALTTARFAPTVTASDNKLVAPSASSLTITGYAPTVSVTTGSGVTVTPGKLSLTLTNFAPTVSVSDNKRVTPGVAALTTSTFAPNVSTTGNVRVTPITSALLLSTYAPTVTGGSVVVPSSGGGGPDRREDDDEWLEEKAKAAKKRYPKALPEVAAAPKTEAPAAVVAEPVVAPQQVSASGEASAKETSATQSAAAVSPAIVGGLETVASVKDSAVQAPDPDAAMNDEDEEAAAFAAAVVLLED